jgi:hypothetical protein
MKKILRLVLFGTLTTASLGACYVHTSPAPAYYGARVWVPGHWQWNGYQNIWVPGHYRYA